MRVAAGVSGARPERRAADFADQVLDRAPGGQRLVPAAVGLGDLQMTEESHPQFGLAQILRLVACHPILEAPFLVVVSRTRRGREGERLDAAAVERLDLDGARFVFQGFEEVDALEIGPGDLGRRLKSPTGQAEVTALVEAVNHMLDRVERAHRSLEAFTADASHELRTPLTHLKAQAQWALDESRSIEDVREAVAAGQETSILELAGGQPKKMSARLWVEALRAGDPYALQLRQDFLDHLAQGLAILIPTFDPECIVLGTIVERNPDLFLEELRARVRRRTWKSLHHVRIEAGALGARLPAYAALCVASLEPDA